MNADHGRMTRRSGPSVCAWSARAAGTSAPTCGHRSRDLWGAAERHA